MSEQPKEGLYLERTLAVIGEQVEERIDEMNRHRRIRFRIAVTVLAVVTVVSGSAAAYAVSTASQESSDAGPRATRVIADVRCTNGPDQTAPAYFTANYRALQDTELDQAAVCAAAKRDLASNPRRYLALSPDEAIAAAARIIEDGGGRDVTVLRASFGTLSTPPLAGTP